MRFVAATLGVLVLSLGVAHAQQKENPPAAAIENGSMVKIEYTLKDDAGAVLDTNKGKDALTFTQGQRQIVPGLEKALVGMRTGEEKKVTVKPEDGYGKVDPKAQMEVSKEAVPADALKVGTQLQGRSPTGQPILARVKEIKDKSVVLDMNHPLAGKTLYFDVKILGVERPAK
jgi:FKBP-type peptidyl-prolyl cis-trans isomerase SlyD